MRSPGNGGGGQRGTVGGLGGTTGGLGGTTVGGLQGDSGGLQGGSGGPSGDRRGTAAITVYLYNPLYNTALLLEWSSADTNNNNTKF